MASILLIDDHPAICFAIKILLEKDSQYQVETSNGENLLQLLHYNTPDLVILDLELNGTDGLDVLPRIKHNFPGVHILIYTNQPVSLYARRTLQAGADGFISKSHDLTLLESACKLILNGYHCFPDSALMASPEDVSADIISKALLSRLSNREMTVLHYLKRGKSNKEIADFLNLSNKTVSTYKIRITKKCNIDDVEQLYPLLDEESGC